MLIKYLRSLLEAYLNFKRNWIGSRALPSSSKISYTPVVGSPSNDVWGNLTAPDNGYIVINIDDSAGEFIDLKNKTANVNSCVASFVVSSYTCFASVYIPVAQGHFVSYHIYNSDGSTNGVEVFFVKNLGSA